MIGVEYQIDIGGPNDAELNNDRVELILVPNDSELNNDRRS